MKKIILFLFFTITLFASCSNEPKHNVTVDYTIYTPAGAVRRVKTVQLHGTKFMVEYTSYKGSNTYFVRADENTFFYTPNNSECLYQGTNDVFINKIIVK